MLSCRRHPRMAPYFRPIQNYFSDESLSSQEIRRGLNDVFAHDLIPDPSIITAALQATRRVDDFPT